MNRQESSVRARGMNGWGRGAAALGVAAFVAVAPTTLARQQPAQNPPPPVTTMLYIERDAAGNMLPSEKDAALMKAIGMIPARLYELREQVPDLQKIPKEAIDLFVTLASKPIRMIVTNKGFDPQTGVPGIGAVLSFKMTEGEAEARAMHEQVEGVRQAANAPFQPAESKRFQGMMDVPLPFGVASYGPRKSADGWRYEVIFAAIDDADGAFKLVPGAPAGVKPALRASIDMAGWAPFIQMFAGLAAMAAPPGTNITEQLTGMGVIGPDAISIDFVHGFTADNAVGRFTIHKLGKHAATMALVKTPLGADDWSAIPADATFAMLKKTNLKADWANLKKQLTSSGEVAAGFNEALAKVKAATGVDVETELVPALGDTMSLYLSDTTGGSSFMSGVALVRLDDVAKAKGVLDKLSRAANGFFDQNVTPPAAAELARFEQGGASYAQLRFPGLPVPLEPTIGVAGNWLVIGATPQAAVAASRHILEGKANGLGANPRFSGAKWNLGSGAQPVSAVFVDTARTLSDGYALMTFGSAMIENLARTKSSAASVREPGLVLPFHATLLDGVKPGLCMTYWDGDDRIMEWHGERSLLAWAAGSLGIGDFGTLISGAIVGAGIGAKAAEEASKRDHHDDDGHDDGGHDDDGMGMEDQHDEDKGEPVEERKVPY